MSGSSQTYLFNSNYNFGPSTMVYQAFQKSACLLLRRKYKYIPMIIKQLDILFGPFVSSVFKFYPYFYKTVI